MSILDRLFNSSYSEVDLEQFKDYILKIKKLERTIWHSENKEAIKEWNDLADGFLEDKWHWEFMFDRRLDPAISAAAKLIEKYDIKPKGERKLNET